MARAARHSILSRHGVTFETAPRTIGPAILAMSADMGTEMPVFVHVDPLPGARPGWCFENVDRVVARSGGRRAHGWLYWASPAWLNAEFHAIWQSPEGRLIDVTPKPDGEQAIVFAEDPAFPSDFDFFRRPNNRRRRTYAGRSVAERVADLVASYPDPVLGAQCRRAAKQGTTLEDYIASRLPPDRLERTIDAFLACADEAERLMVPGPTGMTCTDDRRLLALEIRKLELAERLEREWAARPQAVGLVSAETTEAACGGRIVP